jgi:hypothetical protein
VTARKRRGMTHITPSPWVGPDFELIFNAAHAMHVLVLVWFSNDERIINA